MSSVLPVLRSAEMTSARHFMRMNTMRWPLSPVRQVAQRSLHWSWKPAARPVYPIVRTFASKPEAPQPSNLENADKATQASDAETVGEKAPKGGFRERLRVIMRRYGWWAVGVYLVLGTIDLGIIFALVHYYGGDKVREIERTIRRWIGLNVDEATETVQHSPDTEKPRPLVAPGEDKSDTQKLVTQLTTEFVLAYGIHKTLLLPVRAAITAAITPGVVRWLVRRGWARPIKTATAKSGSHVKA